MSPCGLPIRSQPPLTNTSLPIAQAASSTTQRPWRRAMATIVSISHGIPSWCTHRIARVRVVIAASIAAGFMFSVAGSMSMNTGTASQ